LAKAAHSLTILAQETMIRTPEALIPYLLAVAALCAGLLWHMGDMAGGLGRVVTIGAAEIGGPYVLIDQNGAVRDSRDFTGKWQLLYFGYTHCPDVCPLTLEMMGDVMSKLGADARRVVPVFITIDPERDTPKVMNAYVSAFGKNFVGLTGDAKSIANVEREYRVYAKRRDLKGGDYAMDHSSVIYLVGPDGKFVTDYNDVADPVKIAADIKARF
jgi:protein SCO1/2